MRAGSVDFEVAVVVVEGVIVNVGNAEGGRDGFLGLGGISLGRRGTLDTKRETDKQTPLYCSPALQLDHVPARI